MKVFMIGPSYPYRGGSGQTMKRRASGSRETSRVKVLFVSHTHPPAVGGVEMHNAKLYEWLSNELDVRLMVNRRRGLVPLFLLTSSFRALALAGSLDVLLLGSGVLGIVGWVAKKLTRKPVIAVTHGLDLTYPNHLYQRLWVRTFLPSLDRLIAVSAETIRVGVNKGIPSDRFAFIPNGVDPHELRGPFSRADLARVLGAGPAAGKVILNHPRLKAGGSALVG